MKKNYLMTLLVVSSFSVNAQKKNNSASDFLDVVKQQHTVAPQFKHSKEINYDWDNVESNWSFRDSVRYTYDLAGNNLTGTTYLSPNGKSKVTNTYDANGSQTLTLLQDWDSTSQTWVNNWKEAYLYDSNKNLLQELPQNWNKTTMSWVNSEKELFTYDASNNLTKRLIQNWDESKQTFITNSEDDYTYSTGNQFLSATSLELDTTNTLTNTSKFECTYDSNGQINGVISYLWNNNTWVNNEQINNLVWHKWYDKPTLFNGFGLLGSVVTNEWNGTAWENEEKETYTYDVFDNETSYLYETWNGSAYETAPGTRNATYSYNSNNSMTQQIQQRWDPTSKSMKNYLKTEYSDFVIITGITSSDTDNSINIYPNPAQTTIYMTFAQEQKNATIKITDMLGKEVRSIPNFTGNQLIIERGQMLRGMYFIQVIPETKLMISKRILIQ